MTDSQKLLAEYAAKGSEAAFRELVDRYIDLVFSTALRMVGGDAHRAQDVAQTVFMDLARQASKLSSDSMLGGWLHRDTCFVAAKVMRGERRRQVRERQAAEMNALNNADTNLAQIAPALDEAINELADADRKAILLRFYERMDLRSVGEALGSSENAAQKRVSRALEELRSALAHRGVTLSAAVLGSALATEAVAAAPAGLAAAVCSAALTVGAAGSGTTFALVKLMAMTKLKLGLLGVVVVAGIATSLTMQHQAQIKLAEKSKSLMEQTDRINQLEAENERLSNIIAQAKTASTLPGDQANELLRLRGQVGLLRRETNELGRVRQENRKLAAQVAVQSETNQVSSEDGFRLRQIHAVDAMAALLDAIKNYATNHNGQYPGDWDGLTSAGLGTSKLPGDLGLKDFELSKSGDVDSQGKKVLIKLRVPLQKPGGGSVLVSGGIDDEGVPYTSTRNVSP